MSESLMERDQGVAPTYSFEYDHIAFDFYDSKPTDGIKLAIAYSWWPQSLKESELGDELLGWTNYDDEEWDQVEYLVRGMLGAQKFNALSRHKNLASILGYSCTTESAQGDDDSVHSWTAFTYPTPEKINEVLDQISPNEGLRFKSYTDGNEIGDEEFAEAFAENTVLISEESPYQLESHVYLKVLGYLGLHGELLETIKDRLGYVIDRSKKISDTTLPTQVDDLCVQDIIYPPAKVLDKVRTGLDVMSDQTGSAMFIPDRFSQRHDKTYLMGMYLHDLFVGRAVNGANLCEILGLPVNNDFEQHAKAIERRYRKLNAAAGKLAVKG